jgi:dTDP-4-amino-4,6-dideoxygalactose transaminase
MTGPPPKIRVPLLVAELPALDRLIPYLERIDRNRWYSNFGPLVQELEARLAAQFRDGSREPTVVTVGNATVGIELSLRALGLPKNAPVLIPALTFVATANAVLSAGLRPVVWDIDPDSWLLTPEIAAEAVQALAISAVVPVAAYGCPQDTDGWSRFYASTGIPVVIDAAAAFGNQDDCGPTCSVFSLHATKTLAAGEGGFVVTRDPKLAQAVRQLSNFGINLVDPLLASIGAVTMVGTNGKLSEYHAAVGLASLDSWQHNATLRRTLYRSYGDAIRGIPGLDTTWQRAPDDCVRSVCCVLLDSESRRDVAETVMSRLGIATRRWYLPLLDRHPAFAHMAHRATPVADDLAQRLIGIPFHVHLDDAMQKEVVGALSAVA